MEIITCNNNEMKINSYIIKLNNKLIVIDPSDFHEIEKKIKNSKLDYIILTHEHFDHIMAVDKLKEKYNCKLIAHEETSKNIQNPSKNLSKFSVILFEFMNITPKNSINEFYINKADITFKKRYTLTWQNINLILTHTPGHSKGSSCIEINNFLFSGDSLFELHDTNIKGPGTNKDDYYNITIPFFKSLKDSIIVLPGHYNSFLLKDKKFNRQ